MNRLQSAMVFGALFAFVSAAGADDPVTINLTTAKEKYKAEIEKFQKSVGDWFDKREDAARKKGDKKAVDAILAERKAFTDKNTLPSGLDKALRGQLTTAQKRMEDAYEAAVKAHVKGKNDSYATSVQQEFDSFMKEIGKGPKPKPELTNANPDGRPNFELGKTELYAIWCENGVWTLRTTSKKDAGRVVFSGNVRVTGDKLFGDFRALEKAKNAKDADWVVNHPDGKGFDFRFATFGGTDGVTFKVGPKAESLTFKLLVNGDDDPKKVLIGKKGVHPKKAEFTLGVEPSK